MFMSMIREKIENHLKMNKEQMEIQAGFTSGGQVEDNLLLLNYCVEETYQKKKTLYVTAIDYKKAFDSVRRSKLIEVMKKYKIHPDIISSVVSIYEGDSTIIKLNSRNEEVINITSGIRQGCTGSTTLFKLITYEIAKEVMATGMGFRNEQIYVPLLLFADDGLMLAQDKTELKHMLKVLIKASEQCGLQINKDKSIILIYDQGGSHEEIEIEGIPVTGETKYLGIKVSNRRDIFKEQRQAMMHVLANNRSRG